MPTLSRESFDARFTPDLYRNLLLTARKRIGRDCAEDVVADTLLTAWQSRADFAPHQGQDAFAAWLHGHLHNHLARCIVAQARQQETTLPSATIFELCDGPDAPHWEQDGWQAQRAELYRRLHNFALTPRQRDCCLLWIGGEMTQRQIGASLEPPVGKSAVCKIIQRVGKIMAKVDDPDVLDREIGELIENQPAALTYAGQMQRDNRVRREADLFAMKIGLRREASRVAPRVKPVATVAGNRKARRAANQQRRAA